MKNGMKTIKRLVILFCIFLLLAVTPVSALGAGVYVPTVAKTYELRNGKWKYIGKKKYTYTKDGKIKKYETTGFREVRNYTWKGNYVVKQTYTGQGTGTWTFKYKKGFRQSEVFTSAEEKTTETYKWDNSKASVKYKTRNVWNSDAGISSITVKVNDKKQIISVNTKYKRGQSISETYCYHINGNLEEAKTQYGNNGPTIIKYNMNGYITSMTVNAGTSSESTTTYTYTMNPKKNCPKSVLYTVEDAYGSHSYKAVFSSFKKVRRSRNCDASGYEVPLGINPF